jgi:hypothetical protein
MAVTYDPSAYVTAATNMANKESGYGDTQWNTLSGAMANNLATANKVSSSAMGQGSMWGGQAQNLLDTYNKQYMPAMQQQLDFAKNYATPGRLALNRGQAVSGAAQAGDAALSNAKQKLASYGVSDPSGGMAGGALRSAGVATAGSEAAAGTQSDINTTMTGQQLLNQAIQTGLQLPGQAATGAGVALSAQNQAVNAPLAAASTDASTLGSPVQWYGVAGPEQAQWAQAEQAQANLFQDQAKLDAQSGNAGITAAMGGLGALNGMMGSSGMFGSSGMLGGVGSWLGTVAPLAAAAHGGGTIPHYADGGGAIATGAPPMGAPGATVPVSASPSGGAQQDDVNARVEPGEFVMPETAASWYGEKFLQNLVQKAHKERAEQTVAKPSLKRIPPVQQGAPPSFVSPGAQGAIQTGAPA